LTTLAALENKKKQDATFFPNVEFVQRKGDFPSELLSGARTVGQATGPQSDKSRSRVSQILKAALEKVFL
jgi:hypothetical protein